MIYYNNLSAFTEVHYGNTNIDEAYFGNNKVWPEGPVPFGGKFQATYSDGGIYTKDCDENATLKTSDTKPSGYQYTAMTEAIIGNCVTTIGDYAFENCISLTNVTIPDSVTTIGQSAFFSGSNLTSITIPDSITTIELSTFVYCTNLESINIPDSVTSIGGNAFYGCSSLTSVTIPSGVTSIGRSAFRSCRSLTGITCEATTPPTLGSYVFDDTNNCTIYVPAASVNAYKTASGWSRYADRIQPMGQ